jgi:hypothetical protein
VLSDKLVSLLQTFSKVELNRLRKLVVSPYFNEDEDVIRLFDYCSALLKKAPDQLERASKVNVWNKLFPNRSFDDAHLRRTASALIQLAIRFKSLELHAKSPLEEALFEQKALETAGLDKHLAGVERQINKAIEETIAKNADFYLFSFQYHWNIFNRSYRVVAVTDYMAKLLPADEALEYFYITQKLKMYVAWLSYRQFRSTHQELPLPPGFWEQVQSNKLSSIPMVTIYQLVIRILTEPSKEDLFVELLHQLDVVADKLAPDDYRECCYIAQNYCALKINQGKSEYYLKAFEIFKNMANHGVLIEDGQLPEGVYKNIITTGLRAGALEWVETFIQNYSQYLPPAIRDNAKAYNLANLFSHQKKYQKALEVLRGVEYSDVTYTLGAKTILLRIYYEQGEYIALDSLIDSFRIYLRRNKMISKNLQKEYNNFLNLVKKLTTIRAKDKKALEELKEKVLATSYNTPKKWLIDKLEELS